MNWNFWNFYCPRCGRIENRLQVAKGSDTRMYWYRCRDCGERVYSLKEAMENAFNYACNNEFKL